MSTLWSVNFSYTMCFAACNVSVEGVSGDDVAHRELRKQEMMSLVYSGVVGEKTVKGITAALLVSDADRWLMPRRLLHGRIHGVEVPLWTPRVMHINALYIKQMQYGDGSACPN